MMDDERTPEELRESMRLARGPLGDFVSRYPMMFAISALISWRDKNSGNVAMKNGTVTLLKLGGRQLGVTCDHVVEKFFEVALEHQSAGFQIGNHKVDLRNKIVDRSGALDLAVIDLSDWTSTRGTNPAIACSFFEPREWPPALPRVGNVVELGGFPGAMREFAPPDRLDFHSFSVAKTPVASISPSRITVQFDRESWLADNVGEAGLAFRSLYGMSGGPVTTERSWPSGLWLIDLVGIIYEYSESFDVVFARPLTLIREDGTISGFDEGIC